MTHIEELLQTVEEMPQRPGVYQFISPTGQVLYVGKSISLKNRVKSYFMGTSHLGPRTTRLLNETATITCIETESEIEALLLESELIKEHKPEFNSQWKDDKRYKYIKINNARLRKRRGISYMVSENMWPWVTTSRDTSDKWALYFGPFPAGNTVNQVLRTLRKVFPWCKYSDAAQAHRAGKPCFYSHIMLCPGICADSQILEEYWHEIDQLIVFLSGRKDQVQKHYRNMMQAASEQKSFEKAAQYRDTLKKLEYVTQQFHAANDYLENPNLVEDIRAQEVEQLVSLLKLPYSGDPLDFMVEGYDISNTGATHTTASRVVSVGGQSDKQLYRRYKIHVKKLPNDYAAMEEVLTRRFKRGGELPHLIMIDGGRGQLGVGLKVQKQLGTTIPMVGLAKREEILIVPTKDGEMFELRLPKNSPALQLVQRLRDESHRFARAYHRLLREKGFIGKK